MIIDMDYIDYINYEYNKESSHVEYKDAYMALSKLVHRCGCEAKKFRIPLYWSYIVYNTCVRILAKRQDTKFISIMEENGGLTMKIGKVEGSIGIEITDIIEQARVKIDELVQRRVNRALVKARVKGT